MNEQINKKMHTLKNVFITLLVLDCLGLVWGCINLFPLITLLPEYGKAVLIVTGVIFAIMVVITVFEILAKVFLIRSTAPTFDWSSGRKGYMLAAKFVLLFSILSIIVARLSLGGEGATLFNQGRMYLDILLSIVEACAVLLYLRTAKMLVAK